MSGAGTLDDPAAADPPWEDVHTRADWYDGPRGGAADYGGAPHWYRSVYLDTDTWDPDEDRFELTPLAPEAFAWETERSAVFARWDAARRAGQITWDGDESSHGALPDELERYRELERAMEGWLTRTRPVALVRGTFSPDSRQVRWRLIHELRENA